jgi:hypothetical protein
MPPSQVPHWSGGIHSDEGGRMKSNKTLLLVMATALLLCGCSANTYNAKIATYATPAPPTADETSIFIFRENTALGGARKFAIIDNDTVMTVLEPGTFSHFTVKSGEHEIVAHVAGPLMHYRVVNRPGETVYLHCKMGYTTGMFIEEINRPMAEEMISRFKYMDIEIKGKKIETNYKDYYDKLFK